tara:strand:+ start:377 stop:556 length:180 start_codon:yes stop_codon:yes gene_type:complete
MENSPQRARSRARTKKPFPLPTRAQRSAGVPHKNERSARSFAAVEAKFIKILAAKKMRE